MFKFLDTVVGPLITAAEPSVIVEIGALRGDNTKLVLDLMPATSTLHVIDPVPDFDVDAHRERFGDRYRFHEAMSVDVLGSLPPADVALIDGDHNWYTVYTECNLLAEVARSADRPLPLMIFHDTAWPYGRRDMYYDPTNVPDEHRQPHARLGMARGKSELVNGGMNRAVDNALHEGGPRNGVATGIDDFVAGCGRSVRRVEIPIYFGLTVLADEEHLAARPALVEVLDRIESAEGRFAQAELAEQIRTDGATLNENLNAHRGAERRLLERRHLELVKRTLVDTVDAADAVTTRRHLDHLDECLDTVRRHRVKGDLVVCGAADRTAPVFFRAHLDAHNARSPELWVADPFRAGEGGPLAEVRELFDHYDLLDDRVRFLQGELADSLGDAELSRIALLQLDAGAVEHLDLLYPLVGIDGVVIADGDPEALQDTVARIDPAATVERVDHARVWWQKATAASDSPPAAAGTASVPLMGHARPGKVDLSVVVVFFNMAREAARTLHSLSRAYQQGIDDITTEIIVIDNGSDPDQRLDEATVRSYGQEFRFIDMGDGAGPSPTAALNTGGSVATGRHVAFMIDGAHVLTPGVFSETVHALDHFAPAVVAVQSWFVGPGLQARMIAQGYDTEAEDRLLELIEWPADGYRLFEVGHFAGTRDWFDFMTESGFLAAPRKLFEQVGMYDGAFDEPGGGFASLDLFERLTSSPDHEFVSLLGEASFHQVHGGTTSRTPTKERDASITGFASHYEVLRGKPFTLPDKPLRYLGSLPQAAKRTRARRRISPLHARSAATDADGAPSGSHPIQTDLRDAFVEAAWGSNRWADGTWLGHHTLATPDDLFFIQELIVGERPEVIVDIAGSPGHALFLASLCELVEHGEVVWATAAPTEGIAHPRLAIVDAADPIAQDAVDEVQTKVGDRVGLLLLAGRANAADTIARFEAYQSVVGHGGHAVIEQTIVNGNPVWDTHGPGPGEAVRPILSTHPDFELETAAARLPLSFNTGGYLRRTGAEARA